MKKIISNNIPKGILSFALKAATNSLNKPDYLKRIGKHKSDKCSLCYNYGNLEDILNWCSYTLNQGRMTWRHNSVLNYITNEIKKKIPGNIEVYADIPDHWLNGSTIPPDIICMKQKPDLVIVDRAANKVRILELTCSFEKEH